MLKSSSVIRFFVAIGEVRLLFLFLLFRRLFLHFPSGTVRCGLCWRQRRRRNHVDEHGHQEKVGVMGYLIFVPLTDTTVLIESDINRQYGQAHFPMMILSGGLRAQLFDSACAPERCLHKEKLTFLTYTANLHLPFSTCRTSLLLLFPKRRSFQLSDRRGH